MAPDQDQFTASLRLRVNREREARKTAERILEEKSRELYLLNQELETRVMERTRDLESAKERALALLKFDHLTGLESRNSFETHIAATAETAFATDEKFLLLMVDLDLFKEVNDTHGHEAGDLLLCEVARRLKTCVRATDFVSRLGGDEFAIICTGHDAVARMNQICERIVQSVQRPFRYKGRKLQVSCSVGAAVLPDDAQEIGRLRRYADTALYVAKATGRAGWASYHSQMGHELEERRRLTADLHNALEARQLQVWFQPQVDCETGLVNGMEALARWHHPEKGFIRPDIFIALAEEGSLIVKLGMQILETACNTARPWIKSGYIERIAVNVSPRQLDQPDFIEQIKSVLETCSFRPSWLELEITENYLMTSVDEAAAKLDAIHDLGAKVSLDDFGTGYSNLNFLKRLPLDTIKIDKSFVDGVVDSEDDFAIVQAIIRLAQSFKLHTVAEGVETVEQHAILAQLGCADLQGYLFAKPMDARTCQAFLMRNFEAMQLLDKPSQVA